MEEKAMGIIQLEGKPVTSFTIGQTTSVGRRGPANGSVWLDGRQGIVEINWRTGLLEQIRSFVGSTYVSRSGGGNDVGGVLFGTRNGDVIEILTWRQILRGRDATSHFYLNSKEEQGLSKLLKTSKADRSLDSMDALGWFRSKSNGEAKMEEHDLRFHEKFFEGSAQFAMIVRSSKQRPALASLNMRNENGLFDLGVATAMFTLQPGPVGVPEVESEILGSSEFEVNETPKKRFSLVRSALLLVASIVLACVVIVALQWNAQRVEAAKSNQGLGFEVVFDGSDVKARWNPTSSTILAADNAQLLLGGERLQLSHSELAQGFLRVPMKTEVLDDTEISLKVGSHEEVAQLVVAAR